jgi:patatin-like phospholipase/acyl hydrolase
MTEPYRILALDGGGLRGLFTAGVLAEAEDAFGTGFLASFDLLVGTSTGGIIALGLASGRSCREMLGFYRDIGPRIFARPRRLRRAMRPKYDRRPLDDLLRREFGETTLMNTLVKPVCITAHELVKGTTRVFKDDHSPELRWGGDQLVWKVAAATSAAPTYFAPVRLGDADSHIDGGVWGNNPAMVGLTEAVRYAGRQLTEIRLLSIGTTSQPLRVESHEVALRMGLEAWAFKALHLLQDSAAMAADNQARLLLGEAAYLRLDSERAHSVKLDDATQCGPLQEWGQDVGRRHVSAIGRLLDLSPPVRS